VGKKRSKRRTRGHRVLGAVMFALFSLLILSTLALSFVPAQVLKTSIVLSDIGPQTCSPWPLCQYSSASTSSSVSAGGTVTAAAYVTLGQVGETWQKSWIIHYVDGSTKFFNPSDRALIQFEQLPFNSAPAWIDVVVGVVLDVQLNYHADPWPFGTVWHEEMHVLPYTSAIVDNLQVGQRLVLTPIIFTNDDPVGTEHDYTVRVIFNGNPGPASGAYSQTIDATGSLNGKTSANFMLSFHEVVSQWAVYTAVPIITGVSYSLSPCPNVYGYVPLPYSCQVGPSKAFDPPGSVIFTWNQGACVGGCTVTAWSISFVSCPPDQGGTNAICVANPSVSKVITTGGLTVTIIANKTVVSILPANLNGTTGQGPFGFVSGACGITIIPANVLFGNPAYGVKLPDWLCGSTLGINNLVLVIIIGIVILILLGLALRRRTGKTQGTSSSVIALLLPGL